MVTTNRYLFLIMAGLLFFYPKTGLSSTPEQSKTEFREGMFLLGEGDYQGALEKFETAANVEPLNANVHYYLGEVYAQLGEYEKAVLSYQRSLALNPQQSGEINFKLGLAYYRIKDYPKAFTELQKATVYFPEESLVYYYQGLTSFYLKRYHQTVTCMKKSREVNPDLTLYTYYWEGVSLFSEGLYKRAEKVLKRLDTVSEEEFPLKKSAEEVLRNSGKYSKPWDFGFSFWVEYDDNVTLKPSEESVATGISGKEDWRIAADFKGTHRTFRSEGEYGVSYEFYQSLHQELSDYNLQGHTGSIYFASDLRPFQPVIRYSYAYYFLDEDPYLGQHSLTPSLNVWGVVGTEIFWEYANNDYLASVTDPATDRDSVNNILGMSLKFPIVQERGYLKVKAAYEDNNADGSDWDYSGKQGSLTLFSPLFSWKGTSARLNGEYTRRDFDNVDSSFGAVREDDEVSGTAEIIYSKSKKWDVTLSYKYTHNDSNLDFYHYQRNISSLLYRYYF